MNMLRLCIAVLASAGAASLSLAQLPTPVSFKGYTSLAGETPGNIYAVDLNNDGVTDVLQDTGQSPPGFTVSLGNGNGTFKAPVLYTFPPPSQYAIGTSPMATADFNSDGKVDVAVIIDNTSKVAMYPGNGSGTLGTPKISTISLPSGWVFQSGGAVAADFNGDGKIDIAAWAWQPGSTTGSGITGLWVMQGDGTGGFSTPRNVFYGPRPEPDFKVFAGDFDSYGKTDLIANEYVLDNVGNDTDNRIHVCYGNSDFTFDCTIPYTVNDSFFLGSGDLNSDSISDFYAIQGGFLPGNQKLAFFYGQKDRTFNSYFLDVTPSYTLGTGSAAGDRHNSQLTMADFNGDGKMDLACVGYSPDHSQAYLVFLLGGDGPDAFTMQAVPLPATYTAQSMPIVGLFSGSRVKPSLVLSQSPNVGVQNKPSYLLAEVNQANSGWFGPCPYPRSTEGFSVCSAGVPKNGKNVFGVAAASIGQLRKIELWVDGKKVAEQWNVWDHHGYFNWAFSFPTGRHRATLFAADVDNRLQRFDFTFGYTYSCSYPFSLGVHICSPLATSGSLVEALASSSISGTRARFELWVDGVKRYTETNLNVMDTYLSLPPGTHRFAFVVVNTAGQKWESAVNTVVK